jgi:Fe-S oxidoreductase
MNLNAISEYFISIRENILCYSLADIKNMLKNRFDMQDCFIHTFGGYDEKIIILSTQESKALVCSVDCNIISSHFYQKYSNLFDENNLFEYTGYAFIDMDFIDRLYLPKVLLVSLAKNDIYTYPRFALGISDIAHTIRSEYLGSVTLYDLQLSPDIDNLIEIIKKNDYDIIGLSMTFGLFDIMVTILDKIQKENIVSKIVIGGSLASITYEKILNNYNNVFVSLADGETFFIDFIEYYLNNRDLKSVSSLAYYDTNTQSITKTKSITSCSYSLSLPEFDLLIPTIKAKGVFQIETSRGCYNACSFCPRKHKGVWKGISSDVNRIDRFLDQYLYILNRESLTTNNIIYVVDEEFIGANNTENYSRAVEIAETIAKKQMKFETSFRMNAVYQANIPFERQIEKANMISTIRDNGLNRVLIGVESGVDTVLKRFNKNITALENINGIKLVTSLGIPIRFTYITFDPLMNFEELKETYIFQGRTDLLLNNNNKNDTKYLIKAINDNETYDLSIGLPFYSQISYMLVSLECLVGSNYLKMCHDKNLVKNKFFNSLGKYEVEYEDRRIGLMSHYSQLWIDKYFSLDYTLKSLSKIHQNDTSGFIREKRTVFKKHSYSLLGKMIYIIEQDIRYINMCSEYDMKFINDLVLKYNSEYSLEKVFHQLLIHQFDLLTEDVNDLKNELQNLITESDYIKLNNIVNLLNSNKDWQLLHNM